MSEGQIAAARSPIASSAKADRALNGNSKKSTPTKSKKAVKADVGDGTEIAGNAIEAENRNGRKRKIKEELINAEEQLDKVKTQKHTLIEEERKALRTEEGLHANEDTPTKTKGKRAVKIEEIGDSGPSPKKPKQKDTSKAEQRTEVAESTRTPKTSNSKPKAKIEREEEEDAEEGAEGTPKAKRKRKTQEEKDAEAMPLATRTTGLQMFIGAHVSAAKGVQNTVPNCVHIGGNAFAMFLKSQRKWENPPLQDDHKELFISSCSEYKYDAASHVLPHGSYLVNLAQEQREKADQAYQAFLDDLHRCESLGIRLYNFHPGSTGGQSRPSAIARIANALNRAHKATKTVIPVLETMANGGNVIGSTFEDLRDIILQIEDQTRIGVCLDTCHVFAGGYDLRTPTAFKTTLDRFDKVVGIKYLRALHLNDSKAPFDSHRDLHQNIGLGFLGLRAFHNVMNETRFEGLPMVLETPIDHKDPETGKDVEDKRVWAREIKLLEGLLGMDVDSDEFKAMEKELANRGADERKKLQDVVDRKVEKDRKKLEKGQQKISFGGRKKVVKADSGSEGKD